MLPYPWTAILISRVFKWRDDKDRNLLYSVIRTQRAQPHKTSYDRATLDLAPIRRETSHSVDEYNSNSIKALYVTLSYCGMCWQIHLRFTTTTTTTRSA